MTNRWMDERCEGPSGTPVGLSCGYVVVGLWLAWLQWGGILTTCSECIRADVHVNVHTDLLT